MIAAAETICAEAAALGCPDLRVKHLFTQRRRAGARKASTAAAEILRNHWHGVMIIAESLDAHQTLNGQEIDAVISTAEAQTALVNDSVHAKIDQGSRFARKSQDPVVAFRPTVRSSL